MQMPGHKLDVFRASVKTPSCLGNESSIVGTGKWSKIKFVRKFQQGAPCVCNTTGGKGFPLKLHKMEFNARQQKGWDL